MKKINSIAEDIMNEGNLEEAVSSFTQLKIQDRLVPECIVALITCTYEKTGNYRVIYLFIYVLGRLMCILLI